MLNRQKAHRGRAEWADPDASLGLPGHRVGELKLSFWGMRLGVTWMRKVRI